MKTNGKKQSRMASGLTAAMKTGIKQVAAQATYGFLVLYYVVSGSDISVSDKVKVYVAFGYILLPYDLIPESIHIAGFTDDFAAIAIGYKVIQTNLTPAVLLKAGRKIWRWFRIRIKKHKLQRKLTQEKISGTRKVLKHN